MVKQHVTIKCHSTMFECLSVVSLFIVVIVCLAGNENYSTNPYTENYHRETL